MSGEHINRTLISGFEPEYGDDGKIIDFITGDYKEPRPEEKVRQWYEHVLVEKYNYSKDQIETEVAIQMGSDTRSADIGVYESEKKHNLKIIVENKKKKRTDGIDQLKSYMEPSGIKTGVWTNGADIEYRYRPEPDEFEPLPDIPEAGETVPSMDSRIEKQDLEPAKDLVSIFEQAEDEIMAHQGGIDVFDELFKLILTKIYDEVENLHSPDSVAQFRAGPTEDPERIFERIKRQFEGDDDQEIIGVKRKYSDVVDEEEHINLTEENIERIVGLFQRIELMETDMDTLGTGFEALVPNQMKQDKGQYFTPRQVVRMTTEMVDPKRYETVLDPACGSGGFLIYTMRKLRRELVDVRGEEQIDEIMELIRDYASNRAFGLDYDQRLVRVAKAYMLIWGDGRSNIRQVQDSLRYFDWPGDVQALIKEGEFDIILTNPPFAGDFDVRNIREYYDLSSKDGDKLDSQQKDVLFLERCIEYLKEGGRMGIVLPKGDLDEKEKSYVRDHIKENANIKAVVGLHKNTFLPYTGDRTCVLVLEKKKESADDKEERDDIYMAVSERPGKNEEGKPIYKRDQEGNVLEDEDEKPILNTDLDQIAEEYRGETDTEIGYYISYDELEDRINPEYYHPKYNEIDNQLETADMVVTVDNLLDGSEKYPLINGKDISQLSKTGTREYVDSGTPYLRAGDVERNKIDLEDCNRVEYTSDDLKEHRQLNKGDVLISRKGTTGRVSVVTDRESHSIISSEVMKLDLQESVVDPDGDERSVDPFYIAAYLNSHVGKLQIKRHLTGSVSLGINQTDLKAVKVPLPDEETQEEIGDRYRRVREMRKKIKSVDQEALEMADAIGSGSESPEAEH